VRARQSPHVLIAVQNLPVPLDRRVWQEATALTEAGYRVSVICPKGPGDPDAEVLAGVRLFKYPAPRSGETPVGFAAETAAALAHTVRLAHRIHRNDPVDVLQACNPPDTFFLLGQWLRRSGVRFVFDHHDLCPEIYETRFDRRDGPVLALLRALERNTFATADHVIATNDSYRLAALWRGSRRPDEITVVRSGPDPEVMRPGPPHPELRHGRRHLCCYLGVMGHQDGVEQLIGAVHHLTRVRGRDDCHFTLMGFGDRLDAVRALTTDLGLDDFVSFTGRADLATIGAHLSTAAVGLTPDPPSPFNDRSTMNKTLEYMAFGLPVIAFDLAETRASAGPAGVYVTDPDPVAYAAALSDLLDDPDRRRRMGAVGRRRIEEHLGWPRQAQAYVGVYDRLLGRAAVAGPPAV
jgi:glycosyltransferase involved in cell wall biosynthesis